MTGRDHQLIHSDAFAAELEAMGLDQSIFGPHVPAPIFQALVPRRAGVFDEHAHTFGTGDEPAAFTRASDGIYLDSDGDYQVAAANAIRAEYSAAGAFLGYLLEPAITNKCTNYNVNPDAGLTNLVKTGDAAAVMSRVNDAADLAAAGLANICTDGNVIELDNSGGSTAALISVSGIVGNTNPHSLSFWGKKVSGVSDPSILTNGLAGVVDFANTDYQRIISAGVTPTGAGNTLSLRCPPGVVARFVANQLEELSVESSLIVTLGATGTRAIDALSWAAGLAGWSDAEGVVLLDWTPGWSLSDVAAGSTIKPNLWIQTTSATRGLYWEHNAGGLSRILAREGGGTFAAGADMGAHPVAGTTYRTAVRWNAATSEFEPGIQVAGTWIWPAAAGAYTGTWAADVWNLAPGAALPAHLKRCAVFNRDMPRATIERLF